MSVARVKTSRFAARKGKTLKCHKCGREIPKGETYRWWYKGFRSHYKHVRCMTCPAPRTSELESSNLAEAYAAIETAEDALDALGDFDDTSDVESIVNEAGESIQEVADQYREADEAFGGGGSTVSGELAENLEYAADELSQWSYNGEPEPAYEPCDEHEDADAPVQDACDDCIAKREEIAGQWRDDVLDEARSALADASF